VPLPLQLKLPGVGAVRGADGVAPLDEGARRHRGRSRCHAPSGGRRCPRHSDAAPAPRPVRLPWRSSRSFPQERVL